MDRALRDCRAGIERRGKEEEEILKDEENKAKIILFILKTVSIKRLGAIDVNSIKINPTIMRMRK